MNWIRRKPKIKETKGLVGVQVTPQGIAMAYLDRESQERPYIKAVSFKEISSLPEKEQALQQFVIDHQLEQTPCNIVLDSKDYSLTLVDVPAVAQKEIGQALRWLVREGIDFPMEEAVIDFFEVPLVRARDNAKVCYVAAIKRSLVASLKSLITKADLSLKYIDIPEMVFRNLLLSHPENAQGQWVTQLNRRGGKLMLCRDGNIYLVRELDLELAAVEKGKPEEGAHDTLEELATDIQRSQDFCQTYFRQSLANSILLLPTELNSEWIQNSLKSSLGLEVNGLDLKSHWKIDPSIIQLELANTYMAIGAALREAATEELLTRDTTSQSLSA